MPAASANNEVTARPREYVKDPGTPAVKVVEEECRLSRERADQLSREEIIGHVMMR